MSLLHSTVQNCFGDPTSYVYESTNRHKFPNQENKLQQSANHSRITSNTALQTPRHKHQPKQQHWIQKLKKSREPSRNNFQRQVSMSSSVRQLFDTRTKFYGSVGSMGPFSRSNGLDKHE